MDIIHEVYAEWFKKMEEIDLSEGGVSRFIEQAMDVSKTEILKLTAAKIEEIDEILLRKPGLRKNWQVVRKADPRTVETLAGTLNYERRYYRNRKTREHAYLTDRILGIERYERVESGLGAGLCEAATEQSYAKSSEVLCKGAVSRQTVMRKLRQVREDKLEVKEERKDVTVLHIQADEDHVAMQDGRNSQVKLIAIHEPARTQGKRTYLPERFCMSSYKSSTEDFWLSVANEVVGRYGERENLTVYIHGDGAPWIKAGLAWIPNSRFVLDKYHLRKYLTPVAGGNKQYEGYLRAALKADDFSMLSKLVEAMVDEECCTEQTGKDFLNYVKTNREGVRMLFTGEAGGSCAEGLVSHVLSSRLSSRPKGWMDEGLEAMSRLRVYKANGGQIRPEHLRKKAKVSVPGKKKIQATLSRVSDFSPMFTNACHSDRRGTPEYRLFKAISEGGMAI